MLSGSKKISIRQAIIIFILVTFNPAIRVIPSYTAKEAKEAAWLSPIVATILFIMLVLIWQKFYKSYKDSSLLGINTDIAGKFIGSIINFIYLIWVVLLCSTYIRYFSIKLAGAILPEVDPNILIVSMLVLAVFFVRYGIVYLGRISEIILPILLIFFIFLVILLLTYVQKGYLIPVTFRSILPVVKGSMGISGILSYFTFIFIYGDKINNKESIKKFGIQASIFLLITITLIIVCTVGTFSHFVIKKMQLPFLAAVKEISLFETLEKIESIVVAFWIFSDFVLISFFLILALHSIKSMFKLSDGRPLVSILGVLIYFLSMYLANNVFEMEALSNSFLIPGNIILGFIIPAIMLGIGILRKKV